MTVLLWIYLLGIPVAFALLVRDDRRKQPWLPWTDALLLSFPLAVAWPLLAIFLALVTGLLLLQDRRNGAP